MKRAFSVLAFGLILLVGSTTAWAQSSNPVIQGSVQGIELCPQYLCGAAIFTGGFHGQVGANPSAFGVITAAMTHNELPDPENFAAITGGVWELRTFTRRIRGVVLGGSLYNNGDNTFEVQATLLLLSGGSGLAVFRGLLDHNTLIPTFEGHILQIP